MGSHPGTVLETRGYVALTVATVRGVVIKFSKSAGLVTCVNSNPSKEPVAPGAAEA